MISPDDGMAKRPIKARKLVFMMERVWSFLACYGSEDGGQIRLCRGRLC